MGVVAAGVHAPGVFGGKGEPGLLLDGEGVDIGPETDGLSRLAAIEDAHHAGVGAGVGLDAHLRQLPEDALLGAVLVAPQLRVGMDIPAEGGHIILKIPGLGQDLVGGQHRCFLAFAFEN